MRVFCIHADEGGIGQPGTLCFGEAQSEDCGEVEPRLRRCERQRIAKATANTLVPILGKTRHCRAGVFGFVSAGFGFDKCLVSI